MLVFVVTKNVRDPQTIFFKLELRLVVAIYRG